MPSTCSPSSVQRILIRGVTERALVDLSESATWIALIMNADYTMPLAWQSQSCSSMSSPCAPFALQVIVDLQGSLMTHIACAMAWHQCQHSCHQHSRSTVCSPIQPCQSVTEAMTQVFNTAVFDASPRLRAGCYLPECRRGDERDAHG